MKAKRVQVPRLVGVQIAAETLGVSVWTVRGWAYRGLIQSHKLGTRLMVPTTELDRIVAESARPRLVPSLDVN